MRLQQKLVLLSAIALGSIGLVGCAHEIEIPDSAKIVRDGEGPFAYVAEENGMVYVKDTITREPIASAHVMRGDRVDLVATVNEIKVAGVAVPHKVPLDVAHLYAVYFDRAQ